MSTSQLANGKSGRRALVAVVSILFLCALVAWLDGDRIYQWVKVLHVLAVISWMAGLLYLPRLFINHLEVERGSASDLLFQGMERRLMKIIMTPAMIVSWIAGLWLATVGGLWAAPWFWLKFVGVVAMSVAHMWFAASIRRFANGTNRLSGSQWRMANEIPTVLMIVAVVMVIVQPF